MPDEHELVRLDQTLQKIYGERFFDPDFENNPFYHKLGRRAQNKERALAVLDKYESFKNQVEERREKKRRIKAFLAAHPEYVGKSELPEEAFQTPEDGQGSESDGSGSSEPASQVSARSDTDYFDLIKQARELEWAILRTSCFSILFMILKMDI